MLEIRYIAQVGLHVAHATDYGVGNAVALVAVLDAHGIIDHLLKMPPVFRNVEIGPLCIVFQVINRV